MFNKTRIRLAQCPVRAPLRKRALRNCKLCHPVVELFLQLQAQLLFLLLEAQRERGLARHPGQPIYVLRMLLLLRLKKM